LVNVMGLDKSHVEDTTIANSADISNCTMIGSNLMSVVNLVNTNITSSNLTLVANVDNTKIDRSDISYSANISRSDIVDTMLRGCTVQGSRLTSCTAVDSTLRDVNATNSNLASANAEHSNLENVELKRAEVIGTDLKNRKVADQTVVYGRIVDFNGNLDPVHRIGVPNYSGRGSGSSASSSASRSSTAGKSSASKSTTGNTVGATANNAPSRTAKGGIEVPDSTIDEKAKAPDVKEVKGVQPASVPKPQMADTSVKKGQYNPDAGGSGGKTSKFV